MKNYNLTPRFTLYRAVSAFILAAVFTAVFAVGAFAAARVSLQASASKPVTYQFEDEQPNAARVSLQASASKPTVGKGESFDYVLQVIAEGQAGQELQPTPPDFTGFNVSGSSFNSSTKSINGQSRAVTEWDFRISSELPGKHTIPPAKLLMNDPATGKTQEVLSGPVTVTVLENSKGVAQGIAEDIRDIKGPKTLIEKISLFFKFLMMAMALVLLLIIGLVIWLFKRKKKPALTPSYSTSTPTAVPPRDAALAEIARAQTMRHDPKMLYSTVTDALRRFLKDSRNISAIEATTSELIEVSRASLPAGLVGKLHELFTEADMVKFAKHIPTEEDMSRFIEKARGFVVEV